MYVANATLTVQVNRYICRQQGNNAGLAVQDIIVCP